MRGEVTVILNASSGSAEGSDTEDRVREAFRLAGAEARVHRAPSGEEIGAFAKRTVSDGGATIVAGGGDGTVSSVAAALVGSEKEFGVVPLGTLNHFAKDLGIPQDLGLAARTVVEGESTLVDVGEVNGRLFLNNSSIGLYPRIVKHREDQQERLGWGKWPALVWATIHALHRHRPLDVILSVDGREIRRRTAFVFVGNNVYDMEGFSIGTRARLDGGELSVYLSRAARPFGLLVLALRALFGLLKGATGFESFRTAELTIETRAPQIRVATDGEVAMVETPLRYRVRPRSLRVVRPRPDGTAAP
ncbi:MAG: diacylglycerol kinase family lipid kinase [Acidobacteriota bacterium]|nr:diacylglycerol kinase family lipid kinase [Acidobacteriota bacterium]